MECSFWSDPKNASLNCMSLYQVLLPYILARLQYLCMFWIKSALQNWQQTVTCLPAGQLCNYLGLFLLLFLFPLPLYISLAFCLLSIFRSHFHIFPFYFPLLLSFILIFIHLFIFALSFTTLIRNIYSPLCPNDRASLISK